MPTRESILSSEVLASQVHELFFPEDKESDQSVGLELEIWPFRQRGDNQATLVPFITEQGDGLIQLLQKLQCNVDGLKYTPSPNVHRFEISEGGQLTFEPGGQLEYSGAPKATLAEAIQDITLVIEQLRCGLKKYDIWFFHSGLNPWYGIDQVGLQLTKDRYIHMNNFFRAIGPYGQKMMRLSTSLQINLDAGNPQLAQRRWLAANLLSPVFTALFGNSPFVEGKATGAYSYRSIIWQNLDPSRTGFQKGFLAPDYQPCPVQQYFEFGLKANCMRLPDHRGEMVFDGQFKSFGDWMKHGHKGFYPDLEDWKVHLSTLFPEVRARGFFEIRFLDAQSKVWCSVPGILLTHLLYNQEACEKVIKWLSPYRTTLPGMLEVAAVKGMDEGEIAELAKRIFKLALKTAAAAEDPTVVQLCERFFKQYSYNNMNPAAELVRLNQGEVFSPAQYRDFEKKQVECAGDILSIICEYI